MKGLSCHITRDKTGLFVKKNHGIEHLYSLAGKKQFFLGPKNDHDEVNQENMHEVISIIDKTFGKQIKKYLLVLSTHTSYMTKPRKNRYLEKRKNEITLMLKIADGVQN